MQGRVGVFRVVAFRFLRAESEFRGVSRLVTGPTTLTGILLWAAVPPQAATGGQRFFSSFSSFLSLLFSLFFSLSLLFLSFFWVFLSGHHQPGTRGCVSTVLSLASIQDRRRSTRKGTIQVMPGTSSKSGHQVVALGDACSPSGEFGTHAHSGGPWTMAVRPPASPQDFGLDL